MKRKLLITCLFCIVTPMAWADDDSKSSGDAEKAKTEKPDTIELKGVFEAVTATEIKHETEHLTSFVIAKIVPSWYIRSQGPEHCFV